MPMPRLFTAIDLPPDVKMRLSLLRAPLAGARWIPTDNLHVTLRFFGDMPGHLARDLQAELDDVSSEPFDLVIKGCGAFGGRQPTTLYVNVEPAPELMALARAHDRIARRLGLPDAQYTFHPHITLARLRNVSSMDVAHVLEAHARFTLPALPIDSFQLLSSKPNTGGGPYGLEGNYPFDIVTDGDWDEDEAAAAVRWDSRL
jgi:RNA 2',3'-cyclic 3'-phosphodiesterase